MTSKKYLTPVSTPTGKRFFEMARGVVGQREEVKQAELLFDGSDGIPPVANYSA